MEGTVRDEVKAEVVASRSSVAKSQPRNLDAFYAFLDLVDVLGEGRVFLLEAASDEGRPEYQMSLVGVAPVVEVQVKDGNIHLFAVDGLGQWLTEKLKVAGYEAIAGERLAVGHASAATLREALPTPRPSVVGPRAVCYAAADPMAWLEALRTVVTDLLPVGGLVPFSHGLLGYIGYDAVHYLEKLPKTTLDDRDLPDIRLQWHAGLIQIADGRAERFDSLSALERVVPQEVLSPLQQDVAQTGQIIANLDRDVHPDGRSARLEAMTVSDNVSSASFGSGSSAGPDDGVSGRASADGRTGLWQEDVTQAQFEANVSAAKAYIRAGDIFQVVLSKRMRVKKVLHPYVAYDRLRKLNPSPYMFVAEYPDMRVFGASPEVQFRSVGGRAEMKPIAGTSKGRGKTPEDDRALADRLLNDEKERAEHVMLVDLCRNDLGRVCQIGSIEVPELMIVEPYSHLFHMVSVVRGLLRPDVSVFHALLATFPAGTLSGAPKIRAMEIIDELESLRRGPYGGMIGMIDFAGNANTAIVIRTVVEAGGEYFVQVGAGIVADSVETQEWLECGHKAGATIEVLTGR